MTTKEDTLIPPDVMADMQAIADAVAARLPLDPGVAKRVRERSQKAQEELLRKHGVRAIAVDLIRQGRDEERKASSIQVSR